MSRARRKWLLVLGYWLVQSVLVVAIPILLVSIDEYGFHPPSLTDLLDGLLDPEAIAFFGTWNLILTACQALLVLPWQLNLPTMKRGKSVKLSLAVSGLLIGVSLVGFVLAMLEALTWGSLENETIGWTFFGALLLSWIVCAALLLAYCSRSRLTNDRLLTRVARILFAGTVVETIALIPLNVMIRRKTDCYCFTGGFLTLNICAAVGVIAAGPAFFLPLFASAARMKRAAGKCAWCGYDRASLPAGTVCPECGRLPPVSSTERPDSSRAGRHSDRM